MRKFLILLPLLLVPVSAWSQVTPRFELFGGYSNMWVNANTSNDFDLHGVGFSAQENLNSWFGGVLDFSTHFGSENGFHTNNQTVSYGPVFSYRKHPGIVPFGHVMVGAERGGSFFLNISQPETRLAILAGGGVDIKIRPNVSLRIIQVDYVESRFSNARQDNLRISGGLVFNLGRKR